MNNIDTLEQWLEEQLEDSCSNGEDAAYSNTLRKLREMRGDAGKERFARAIERSTSHNETVKVECTEFEFTQFCSDQENEWTCENDGTIDTWNLGEKDLWRLNVRLVDESP